MSVTRYVSVRVTVASERRGQTDPLQLPDRALRLAVGLANTRRFAGEHLHEPADLRQFLLDHGEPEPVVVDADDLSAVRVVRERLREVFQAPDAATAATILNGLLAESATRPYLSDHDGTVWHIHLTAPDAGWAQWLAATTAMGLATVLAHSGVEALRVCAAPDCEVVFAAPTRQRVRRFCSPTCATRTRVSSHRARRRGSAAAPPAG